MYNRCTMTTSSQTQQCLLKAFVGESQARNKYFTFAKMARKEGLEWIARVFEETADNERTHAEELFEMIEGTVSVPNITLDIHEYSKNTDENLKMAAAGEKYEWTTMYTDFEWKCVNCGYIHRSKTPPVKCPVCQKPKEWYMPLGLVR